MLSKVKLYRGTIVIYYSKQGILRHNTGIRIDEKYFSESKLILKSSGLENYKVINDSLIKIQRRMDAIILQLKSEGLTPTVSLVKEKLKDKDEEYKAQTKKAKTSVIDVMEDFYSMKKGSRIKPTSLKVYRALINALKDYETSIEDVLLFKDISREFLQTFEHFLTESRPYGSLTAGNLNDNTIAKRFKVLREFWRYAVHEEIAEPNVDLESYKVSCYETDIIIISENELRILLAFETDDVRERKVLDVFLFGCMTGMRFSDIVALDSSNVKSNIIGKYAKKTGGYFEVPMNKTAQMIWERNEACLNHYSLQKFNLYLKQLLKRISVFENEIKIKRRKFNQMEYQKVAKWTQISSHSARRTFITNCIKNNVPINEIMKMTGHSSISMLLNYMQKFGDKTFDFVERLEMK